MLRKKALVLFGKAPRKSSWDISSGANQEPRVPTLEWGLSYLISDALKPGAAGRRRNGYPRRKLIFTTFGYDYGYGLPKSGSVGTFPPALFRHICRTNESVIGWDTAYPVDRSGAKNYLTASKCERRKGNITPSRLGSSGDSLSSTKKPITTPEFDLIQSLPMSIERTEGFNDSIIGEASHLTKGLSHVQFCGLQGEKRMPRSSLMTANWLNYSSRQGVLGGHDIRCRWRGSVGHGGHSSFSTRYRSDGPSQNNNSGHSQKNGTEDPEQEDLSTEKSTVRRTEKPNKHGEHPLSKPSKEGARDDDHIKSILNQMRTIPNIITLSRIASAPVLSYFIVTDRFDWAIGGCLVFAFTDWLDGHIARNYEGQATVLGTYLDPLADKFIINVLSASLWYVSLLPGPIVALWLARDVGLVYTSYRFVANRTAEGRAVTDPSRTPLKVNPTLVSRVNTVLQFGTISAGMAQPLFGLPEDVVLGLCGVTAGTTVASALSYLGGESMVSSGNKPRKGSG